MKKDGKVHSTQLLNSHNLHSRITYTLVLTVMLRFMIAGRSKFHATVNRQTINYLTS